MANITIQKETTIDPISLIGREAGVCWGADIADAAKNYKRGMDCLVSGHGRTWEYPQVYVVLDGYSARVIRELYTHIGGAPTRLQASTRYIDYQKGFAYVVPPAIEKDAAASAIYADAMDEIKVAMQKLEALNIPREDCAMLLPLGMESKVVLRTNLRNLIDMAHQRLCTRAYWEYRRLMQDLMQALGDYSDEWKYLVDTYFVAKCEVSGFCTEKKSCGRKPQR
ncbi:MAG: FAD-dependent thymidylate synthase [Clostridia bacterium]|nr:FAD-dependent thymidylate synthase [Clostridia bacterium]